MAIVLHPSSAPAVRPESPVLRTVTPLAGALSVVWDPPASNGGSPVLRYNITVTVTSSGASATVVSTGTGSITSIIVSGLANGTSYTVSVVAVNTVGVSPSSNTLTGTPVAAAVSLAPVLTSVTPFDHGLTVVWAAPTNTGGSPLQGYTVTVVETISGNPAATQSSTSTSVNVVGLTNGIQYTVSVVAVNGVGSSAASNTVTGIPAPGAAPPPPGGTPTPTPLPPANLLEQPIWYAFPAERAFRPENWLLTPEEVDAL